VVGLIVLGIPFRTIPAALLERRLQLGRHSAVHVTSMVSQSCIVLVLASRGYGYWALASGSMIGRLLEAVALSHLAGWTPRLRRLGRSARDLVRFGLHVTGAGLLWFFCSQSDYFIVGRMTSPVVLGYYSLALQLISMPVQKLSANFAQVSYPVFCRVQHDPGQIRKWYLRLTALLGSVGLPVFVGMALVAEEGIPLVLGEKWRPAVLPFRLLSVAGLTLFFNATLPPLFNALNRPDIPARFNAACAVLLPAGFALFGVRYGIIGVCWVWLVVYPLFNALLVSMTRNVTGFGLNDVLRSQAACVAATALMAAVVVAEQRLLDGVVSRPVHLTLAILTGAVSYGVALVLFARHSVLRDFKLLLRELKG
jgi:O-antigen/teichoic acid export membrane protein